MKKQTWKFVPRNGYETQNLICTIVFFKQKLFCDPYRTCGIPSSQEGIQKLLLNSYLPPGEPRQHQTTTLCLTDGVWLGFAWPLYWQHSALLSHESIVGANVQQPILQIEVLAKAESNKGYSSELSNS